jgi:hypothetical protein
MISKQQLKFLMELNEDIDKACPILNTDRANVMTALTDFFQAVSLGMELGAKLKEDPKSAPNVPKSKSPASKSKKTGKSTFADVLAKVIGKRTMSLDDIERQLIKSKRAPKSVDLRGYIASTLSTFKTFGSHTRGSYFVVGNQPVAKKGIKKATTTKDVSRSHKLPSIITTILKHGPMRLMDITKAAQAKPYEALTGLKEPSKTVWNALSINTNIERVPNKPGFYRLKNSGKAADKTLNGKALTA